MTNTASKPTVAVVGGGLAGLAAAATAAEHGLHVELFEQGETLGGRAGSFRDPQTGQLVDYCQHVAMGCCTNLADFCRRTGVADCFGRYRRLHFFAPDGTRHDFAPAGWLPAPLHLVPGLMRLRYFTLGERWDIARALWWLAREPLAGGDDETIGEWLCRNGQSARAIEQFWSVVLLSALSETVDRASLAAAKKVFVDGLLAHAQAYELLVPQLPLGEIFDRRVAAWLADRNVVIHQGTRVKQIDGDARRATAVVLPDGTRRQFDFIVVAVPWRRVCALFPESMLAAMPALRRVEGIQPAPITAVHLWFNRPITRLPHATLVGRLSQWIFEGQYLQVVISGSHGVAGREREDILAEVRRDLEAVWAEARGARLLHWRVITRPAAVFSARPGLEKIRPDQHTPVENLMLAGDWTATGWPATMEGAVRSGYLAVEAVLRSLGRNERLLVPDLPRGRLVRWMLG